MILKRRTERSPFLNEISCYLWPSAAALSAWVVVSYPPFSSRHWKVKTSLNVGDDFKILSGFFKIVPVFSVVKWKWSAPDYHDASKSPNKRCKSRGLPHKLLRLGKSLLHWWKNSYVLFFRNHYGLRDVSTVRYCSQVSRCMFRNS